MPSTSVMVPIATYYSMAQSNAECSSFAIPADRREHGDRCAFAILVRSSVCGSHASPFAFARALSRAAAQVEHDSSGKLRNVYMRLPTSMNGGAKRTSMNACGALTKNIRVPLAHAISHSKLGQEATVMASLALGCDAFLRTYVIVQIGCGLRTVNARPSLSTRMRVSTGMLSVQSA